MVRLRGVFGYYGALLRATPGHLWRAADVVSRIALVAVIALFALFGYRGEIPLEMLVGLILLAVLGALAVTEYDRYEVLRADRDKLKAKDAERFQQSVEQFRQEWRWDELKKAIDAGRDKIWKPLRFETTGTEGDWVAKVDVWETATREMVQKHWGQYLAFYVGETGLVATVADWRARLETLMDIKLKRLVEIMTRDIKSRNPGIVFDDENPVSQ